MPRGPIARHGAAANVGTRRGVARKARIGGYDAPYWSGARAIGARPGTRGSRLKVTVLGSGSTGNATLVEAGGVRVLVDAGFSGRSIERRMHAAGIEPGWLDAILITHDHGDHTRGMGVLARRFRVPLYLTERTRAACGVLLDGSEELHTYDTSATVRIGVLEVTPFLTVHDAVDPVAVTLRDTSTDTKLGIATDLGRPTASVRAALAGCHMLVLEANHDEVMLREGPYPWSVKQRIASSHGHLSNRAAGELARELQHAELTTIVLAHLSESCNDGGLARECVAMALDGTAFRGPLLVATQEAPLHTIDVVAARRQNGAAPQLGLF
jgi:phosphoribosyl 1,2-cyclic phosphodiesterase